jgi:hypothetical protein
VLRTVPDATETEIVDWKAILLRDRIKSVEGLRVTVGTSAWSSVGKKPKRSGSDEGQAPTVGEEENTAHGTFTERTLLLTEAEETVKEMKGVTRETRALTSMSLLSLY